jgi:hypothetical protein
MMRSYFALEPAQIAEYYLQSKGGVDFLPGSAEGLVADIERYLRASSLDHRLDERITIAQEAFQIAQQVRGQSEDAEAELLADVQMGYGDRRAEADELARIQAMSIHEFAAERGRLGLQKSTADFLLGQ